MTQTLYYADQFLEALGYHQINNPHKDAFCPNPPRRTYWNTGTGSMFICLDDGSQVLIEASGLMISYPFDYVMYYSKEPNYGGT